MRYGLSVNDDLQAGTGAPVSAVETAQVVGIERLHPWRHNFRFVEDQLGNTQNDADVVRRIAEDDPVEILVELLAQGYDPSMPMVAVSELISGEGDRPDHLTVLVGNRRLAAARILRSRE